MSRVPCGRSVFGLFTHTSHFYIYKPGRVEVQGICGNPIPEAGQIAQNLWVLTSAATGFAPNQVMVMQLRLPSQPERRRRVVQEHLSKIAAIPGVDSVSVASAIPTSDSEQPVFNISSMDQVFANSIASPRFNAFLVGTFALVALAMAAGGMYSVISCLVSQRAGEIAVRIALGAGRMTIVKAILFRTSAWLLGGLAAGCAFGLAASNTMRSFSNSTTSPSAGMFAVLALLFVLVMLLATVIPLRRAIRLDPVATLRCE